MGNSDQSADSNMPAMHDRNVSHTNDIQENRVEQSDRETASRETPREINAGETFDRNRRMVSLLEEEEMETKSRTSADIQSNLQTKHHQVQILYQDGERSNVVLSKGVLMPNQLYEEIQDPKDIRAGDLVVVEFKSLIPKPPSNFIAPPRPTNSRIPVLKPPKRVHFSEEKHEKVPVKLITHKEHRIDHKKSVIEKTVQPNLILTPKGIYSEVEVKPKSTGEVPIKVWFRQNATTTTGPILPSLDSRPVSKTTLERYYHGVGDPQQKNVETLCSSYIQPIPRIRYSQPPRKLVSQKHKMVQKLKIQRELLPAFRDEPLLKDWNVHRLVKTSDVLTIYQFDHFKLPSIEAEPKVRVCNKRPGACTALTNEPAMSHKLGIIPRTAPPNLSKKKHLIPTTKIPLSELVL